MPLVNASPWLNQIRRIYRFVSFMRTCINYLCRINIKKWWNADIYIYACVYVCEFMYICICMCVCILSNLQNMIQHTGVITYCWRIVTFRSADDNVAEVIHSRSTGSGYYGGFNIFLRGEKRFLTHLIDPNPYMIRTLMHLWQTRIHCKPRQLVRFW